MVEGSRRDYGGQGKAGTSMFQIQHDWAESDEISATIIDAVAAITGNEPADLQPLYEAVDPDALDQLLRSLRTSSISQGRSEVVFTFNGCEVTVAADGTITVDPVTEIGP